MIAPEVKELVPMTQDETFEIGYQSLLVMVDIVITGLEKDRKKHHSLQKKHKPRIDSKNGFLEQFLSL